MKCHELLTRQGVVVPERTLHRYALGVCGHRRGPGPTVRVADGPSWNWDAVDGSERRKPLAPDCRKGKAGAVLTEAEIGRFVADGFVVIRGAVIRHVAAACVDVRLGRAGQAWGGA